MSFEYVTKDEMKNSAFIIAWRQFVLSGSL